MNLVGSTFSTCAHLTTNQVSHRHTGTSPYNTRTSPTPPSIIHVSNVGLYYRVGLYKDPIIETIWGILLPVNKLEIVFAGICNHHTNRPVGRCLALLWATDVWAWIHTVPPKPKKSSLPILFMCCYSYYLPCRSDYTQFTEYYTYVRTTSTSANHLTLQKVYCTHC